MTGLGQNGRPVTRSSPHGKKKKTRVVNLRRTKTSPAESDSGSVAGSTSTDSSLLPESSMQGHYSEDESGEVKSPPITPPRDSNFKLNISPESKKHILRIANKGVSGTICPC